MTKNMFSNKQQSLGSEQKAIKNHYFVFRKWHTNKTKMSILYFIIPLLLGQLAKIDGDLQKYYFCLSVFPKLRNL